MSASARLAPTTFYREIDRNRRRSWLLVVAVIVVLGLLGGAIGYATGFGWGGLVLALGLATAMSVGSWFAGDALVMATSGAREIDRANPAEPFKQLVNVVEEMRLAGGLPPPRLWVIDDTAPNAFATGRDPEHASVAVTTGLLDKLDREQLQGVIGHEMSHIGNLDIRFTLLGGVLVGAIALLADWFLRFTYWGGGRRSGSDSDRGGGGAAALIFVIASSWRSPLRSRSPRAGAVSRTREHWPMHRTRRADAQPDSASRARCAPSVTTLRCSRSPTRTQHLYIVNRSSRSRSGKSLWAPIRDRASGSASSRTRAMGMTRAADGRETSERRSRWRAGR